MKKRISVLASCLLALTFLPVARAGNDEVREELEFLRGEFERGRYFRASDALYELLEENPGLVEARVLLLRVEMERGALDAAERLDAELGQEFGEGAPGEVLRARADYAFLRGRTADSEALGRRAVGLDGDDLYARYAVARALGERGARSAAREWVDEALAGRDLKQLGSDGLLDVGRLYKVVGEWEYAAQCCVRAEKRRKQEDRPTTDVLLLLGDLYRLAHSLDGDTPRAFKTYRDALEQNASLVGAKVGRALVHLYVEDSWDAEQEVDDALKINPSSVAALTVKAWFLVLDGRFSAALDQTEKALAINPAAKKTLATRAAALYLLNRKEEYQAAIDRVLELDPTYGEAYHTVGDALSRHLRFEQAVDHHRLAIELDPELALAYVSLGRDLCFLGEEEEGRRYLEKSIELHPFRYPWRNNMLLILKKLDREYVDADTDHFRFRVNVDENAILAPRLQHAFEADLAKLEEKYQWSVGDEILIEMLPAHQDFSVRSVGFAGLGALGACFGRFVTLLSPRSELRRSFVWRRTALHELTHVITIGRSRGRVPRWLTEGLSVYEERATNPTWGRDQELELIDAYSNDELMPLAEFNSYFRSPRIVFAYYQAGEWVRFVEQRYGFAKILEMLDVYASDRETVDVVPQVFGKSCEEMDVEFRQWVYETLVKDASVQPVFTAGKRRSLLADLRKDENDVDVLVDLAWAYFQGGKLVDADVYLDRALRLDPARPRALLLAAHRAVQKDRVDLAIENIEAAFAGGGREYHSAVLLARLRAKEKDFAGAEQAFLIARECFPQGVGPQNPYLGLYQLLQSEGEEERAMEALAEFVSRAEAALEPRLDLAAWYAHHERHEESLRLLEEAEEIDPFVRDVYVRQGAALRALGRPGEAIAALRTALLVDPRLEAGYTSPRSSEDDPARARARAGARNDEERQQQADILISIAEIEHQVGDTVAALRDLTRALQLAPGSSRAEELMEQLKP